MKKSIIISLALSAISISVHASEWQSSIVLKQKQLKDKEQLKNELFAVANRTYAIIRCCEKGLINSSNAQKFKQAWHTCDKTINRLSYKVDERCYLSGEILSTEFSCQQNIEGLDAMIVRYKEIMKARVLPQIERLSAYEIDRQLSAHNRMNDSQDLSGLSPLEESSESELSENDQFEECNQW